MNQPSTVQILYPLVSSEQKVKLTISDDCFNKIKFMCNKISTLEWSGVLLYNVIDPDLDNCQLEAVDFYPVDKGTVGHTAFEYPEGLFEYMLANGLEECKQGLIHSHNNMEVFFSGEDYSELQDNAPKHSLYLSLIVNNRNEMCAKVAQFQQISYSGVKSKRRTFSGNFEEVDMQPTTEDCIYTYGCIITKPEDINSFNSDWKLLADKVINMVPVKANTIYYKGTRGAQEIEFPDYKDQTRSSTYSKPKSSNKAVKVDYKFVREEILNGKNKSLADACKNYKYESVLQGEIIDLYEEYYNVDGPFDDETELEIYQQILDIIKPYKDYKDIRKLIDAINVITYEFT